MIALPQTLPVNKTYLILMAAFGLLLLGIGLFGATHKAEKYVVAALGVGLCVYATMSMPLSMNHLAGCRWHDHQDGLQTTQED
jgi:hypothetical protein